MANLSFKRRGLSVVVGALALLALAGQPLFAQGRICPPPVSETEGNFTSRIPPLEPGQRIVYSLAGLSGGTLQVRYLVNGALHLTEQLDLAKVERPIRMAAKSEDRPKAEPGRFMQKELEERSMPVSEVADRADTEWVVELLTLHPDTVRGLHALAAGGAAIDLEISHDGVVRETISLVGLMSRNADLAARRVLPVYAPSAVSGTGVVESARTPIVSPKDTSGSRKRVGTNVYLETCSECSTEYPCDTECGWDPGKGGPNTCGEQGMPCEPYCGSSWTSGEWWTNWTYYSSGYGISRCLNTWFGYRWHTELVTTYRRERIRRTTTCPNSPSCNGCYDTEATIQVQYGNSYCYQETGSTCFNGQNACCGTCSVYGWSTCGGFPCFFN